MAQLKKRFHGDDGHDRTLNSCHSVFCVPTATGRSASGMTTIAFVGAGQTLAQTPHPVQTSARIDGFPAPTSIAFGTGHRSEHTVQNDPV